MKTQLTLIKPVAALAVAIAGFTATAGHAAVITTFLQPQPTTDVITSYQPTTPTSNLGWYNWETSIRSVGQTFITPGSSDFSMEAISMQFDTSLGGGFDPVAGFSISFYQLASAGQNPELGTFLSSQSGSMQPTIADSTAGSYLTFTLETPISLESGQAYGYVLAFTSPVPPPNARMILPLRISSSQADPSGTRAWYYQDGGSANSAETYAYYIQGTAVPEPGTVALLGLAVAGIGILRRRKRSR